MWKTDIASESASRRIFLRRAVSASVLGTWAVLPCRPVGACVFGDLIDPGQDIAYRLTIPSMGSVIEIRWLGREPDQEKVVATTAKECAEAWVDVLSDYQQDSECMRVCREASAGDWVGVSVSLWQVLIQCDRWHRLTEGAFDAALGALTRLRRSKKEVSEDTWHEARARCGWEHIELDAKEQRVRFHRPGVILDFGAIGKGFVVDRISEQLRSLGIDRFLINASGNMRCGDAIASSEEAGGEVGWPIAIGALGDPENDLKRLRLANCGIATSGDQYQRFRDGGSTGIGTRSSHILDPVQRRGLEEPNMATVITASASDADALATACCVHLQRHTLTAWLSRARGELPAAEYLFQSWRDGAIAYTSVPCDW